MQRVERIYYHYTIAALEDELVRIISSHNEYYLEEDEDGNEYIRIKWDYLDQAEALVYRVNIYSPLPGPPDLEKYREVSGGNGKSKVAEMVEANQSGDGIMPM